MKLLVTGATGFIGRKVVAEAQKRGHKLYAVSRDAASARLHLRDVEIFPWNSDRDPLPAIPGVEGVINLLGEPIAEGRWTHRKMMRILDSRVNGTRNLVTGLKKNLPKILVSASAIGWYGPHGDEDVDEHEPHGIDYLGNVCVEWEREARHAEDLGIKVAVVRIGVVLGKDGGALAKMLTPFKMYVGGPIGSGAQWMSWVHVDDIVNLLLHAVEKGISATYNGTAPNAVTNRQFATTLGGVLGKPSFFPTPGFMLRLALGKVSQILVTGQKAVPKQTLASGFRFKWPDLEPALRDILK